MEKKILQHLEYIDFFIKSYQNNLVTINGGLPGIIIFYFHLHKVTQQERHYDTAIHYMERLYDELETKMPNSNLFSAGLTGISWFLNYIQQFIDVDNEFDSAEFDSIFIQTAKDELAKRNYEFLSGFSGILFYLSNKKSTNSIVLTSFIDDVHDKIFQLKDPIQFFAQKNPDHEHVSFNLGVSHGMFGFVAVLNKLLAKDINSQKCQAIINLIVAFSFKHQKNYIQDGTFFPNRIGKGITENKQSRLAWCYGDLGILTVLYYTSLLLKDDVLQKKVLEMLVNTTHRKDLNTTLMNDVWMCHGTSGAAHIFQRLYVKTQIKDFKFAADYWYIQTLKQLDRGSPQIQTSAVRSGNYARNDLTGFLIGYSGLGLGILGKLQPTAIDWDEMILMS